MTKSGFDREHDRFMQEHIRAILKAQSDLVESDLRKALGWMVRLPAPIIRRLGFRVIYQRPPRSGVSEYRGIRRRGAWVVDHQPAWPFIDSEAR